MLKKLFAALLCGCLFFSSALALEGMDVSVYQGDIDFSAARRGGIEAVYIRAGFGQDGVDSYLRRHYAAASAAGVPVGFYHYLEARTPEEARLEAEHFARLIAPLSYQCRPALDYENAEGLDDQQLSALALAFLERLEELLDKRPMIYVDASYAARLEAPVAEYPLWIAQWDVDAPDVSASPWREWTGWQYTSSGQVPGVSTRVDRDIFTDGVLLTDEEQGFFSYTVRWGDTLWALSRRFGTTVAELARLNDISNPNRIYVGQVLRVPKSDVPERTYTVRRGDTLWGISRRYGTTVKALVELNRIANPDLIYPGQILRLPA